MTVTQRHVREQKMSVFHKRTHLILLCCNIKADPWPS